MIFIVQICNSKLYRSIIKRNWFCGTNVYEEIVGVFCSIQFFHKISFLVPFSRATQGTTLESMWTQSTKTKTLCPNHWKFPAQLKLTSLLYIFIYAQFSTTLLQLFPINLLLFLSSTFPSSHYCYFWLCQNADRDTIIHKKSVMV